MRLLRVTILEDTRYTATLATYYPILSQHLTRIRALSQRSFFNTAAGDLHKDRAGRMVQCTSGPMDIVDISGLLTGDYHWEYPVEFHLKSMIFPWYFDDMLTNWLELTIPMIFPWYSYSDGDHSWDPNIMPQQQLSWEQAFAIIIFLELSVLWLPGWPSPCHRSTPCVANSRGLGRHWMKLTHI